MTPFSSSQGGGPGRSQPPAVTRKHSKRPRKWGSGRSVPVGSMETRDAGGLAPGPAGDRLPSCANRRRGKRSAPRTAERGSGPAPPQRRRSTAGSATAAHPRGEPRRAGERGGRAAAAHPRPFLASQLGTAETSGAQRKHPHGAWGRCVFRGEALYLPGRSVLLPSGVSRGDRGEDCRLPLQHWLRC